MNPSPGDGQNAETADGTAGWLHGSLRPRTLDSHTPLGPLRRLCAPEEWGVYTNRREGGRRKGPEVAPRGKAIPEDGAGPRAALSDRLPVSPSCALVLLAPNAFPDTCSQGHENLTEETAHLLPIPEWTTPPNG